MFINFEHLFTSYNEDNKAKLENYLSKRNSRKLPTFGKIPRLTRRIFLTEDFLEKHEKYHDVNDEFECLNIIDRAIAGIDKFEQKSEDREEIGNARCTLNLLRDIKFNRLTSMVQERKKQIKRRTKSQNVASQSAAEERSQSRGRSRSIQRRAKAPSRSLKYSSSKPHSLTKNKKKSKTKKEIMQKRQEKISTIKLEKWDLRSLLDNQLQYYMKQKEIPNLAEKIGALKDFNNPNRNFHNIKGKESCKVKVDDFIFSQNEKLSTMKQNNLGRYTRAMNTLQMLIDVRTRAFGQGGWQGYDANYGNRKIEREVKLQKNTSKSKKIFKVKVQSAQEKKMPFDTGRSKIMGKMQDIMIDLVLSNDEIEHKVLQKKFGSLKRNLYVKLGHSNKSHEISIERSMKEVESIIKVINKTTDLNEISLLWDIFQILQQNLYENIESIDDLSKVTTRERTAKEIMKIMKELITKINLTPGLEEVNILWDVYDRLERNLLKVQTEQKQYKNPTKEKYEENIQEDSIREEENEESTQYDNLSTEEDEESILPVDFFHGDKKNLTKKIDRCVIMIADVMFETYDPTNTGNIQSKFMFEFFRNLDPDLPKHKAIQIFKGLNIKTNVIISRPEFCEILTSYMEQKENMQKKF